MGSDLLLVLLIVLGVVFMWRGPKTLPKIANALGRGVREARREAAKVDPAGPEDDEPD
jgi:Sec-independent protein translocase protein TatA